MCTRYDVTEVTPSDHSGHDHLPSLSARLCDSSRPIMTALPVVSTVSDSHSQFLHLHDDDHNFQSIFEVDDEIVISTMSSPFSTQDNEIANANDDVGHRQSNLVLPALASDDSNSNFSSDNNCDRTIQPMSPTSSFVLEEEIAPFSTVDNILLDLDLPTVYGDRRPSTDMDLLSLSNNMLSPSEVSSSIAPSGQEQLVAVDPINPVKDQMDQEAVTTRSTEMASNCANGSNGCCDVQINNASQFIQSIKTRNSVFHILLEGIIDKIELIRERTGAYVTFYIIFGTLEFNEKNVHKYLKAREAKLAGPDGKYSRFHLLFNKERNTEQGRRSPQPSTSYGLINGNGASGQENDHDYELQSSRTKSGSDSESEFGEDHLYAATLLRQKVSSLAVHDHQYNNEILAGCFKSRRFDPLLWGPDTGKSPSSTADGSALNGRSVQSVTRRTVFTSNFHRHRCLRNLVEALFEKIKGLENKTGAKVMSLTISYEENLITRQNFEDVFQQLLGVRKTSFVTKFANDKLGTHLITNEHKGPGNVPTYSLVQVSHGFPNRSSSSSDLNGLPILLTSVMPVNLLHEGVVAQGHTDTVSIPPPVIPVASATNNALESQPEQATGRAGVSSSYEASSIHYGPVCAKCSRAVPEGCRNPSEWAWLRCFNPLCFYMVHSTCLGFCVNCGSIDLRQFTFPPFYCEAHRLISG